MRDTKTWNRILDISWCPIVILALGLLWSLIISGGFQGFDDLHYLQAAQHWLKDGHYIPKDHWSARLPLILSFALGLAIFGPSNLALTIPCAAFYMIVLVCCYLIGEIVVGSKQAVRFLLVPIATPVLFRMASSFYPECFEAAASLCMIVLALFALWECKEKIRRHALFLGAGLFGGMALLDRETAIAVPISILILVSWDNRSNLRPVLLDMLLIIVGTATPLFLECGYYLLTTGNPLYRFVADSHHILIPSTHLKNEIYTGGSPLFNWKLAQLWTTPSVLKVHWTINGLLNLFLSPATAMVPLFGLLGCYKAWKTGGRLKSFSLLTLSLLVTQYCINTFVLVIAPEVRYLVGSVVLLACAAGYFIFSLKATAASTLLLIIIYCYGAMVGLAQTSAQIPVDALRQFSQNHQTIFISNKLADITYLERLSDSDLNNKLVVGVPPVGSLAASIKFENGDAYLSKHCVDKQLQWQVVDTYYNIASLPFRVLALVGLDRYLPKAARAYLERAAYNMTLAKRVC